MHLKLIKLINGFHEGIISLHETEICRDGLMFIRITDTTGLYNLNIPSNKYFLV